MDGASMVSSLTGKRAPEKVPRSESAVRFGRDSGKRGGTGQKFGCCDRVRLPVGKRRDGSGEFVVACESRRNHRGGGGGESENDCGARNGNGSNHAVAG